MSREPLDIFGFETSKHLMDVLKKTNTIIKKAYIF